MKLFLPPAAVPAQPAPLDLPRATVTTQREPALAMGMGMSFTIGGHPSDPARVDAKVQAGSFEKWTLINTSPNDHPFHLHVWPMQIIEQSGRMLDAVAQQNVVKLRDRDSVRVRIAFDDFPGKTFATATSWTTKTRE